jgi:histidinol-phosphate phosphatase family protein
MGVKRMGLKAGAKLTKPENRAIFLDRDGTINYENLPYTWKPEHFRFLPGAIEAMGRLAKTDYRIVIVTNQGGVARGLYNEEDVKRINGIMISELKRHGVGVHGVYYCPHTPSGTVKEYSIICECKKPGVRLFQEAAKEFSIDIGKSWVVGDSFTDIGAGKKLGCRTILVKTSSVREAFEKGAALGPDYIADDLYMAVDIILQHEDSPGMDAGGRWKEGAVR